MRISKEDSLLSWWGLRGNKRDLGGEGAWKNEAQKDTKKKRKEFDFIVDKIMEVIVWQASSYPAKTGNGERPVLPVLYSMLMRKWV